VTPRLVGAALALALVACGRVGPPVAPQFREPRPVEELRGVGGDGRIELSWLNPTRRADSSVIRDLAVARVFRAEDAGTGEPRSALRTRRQIAGYDEIATIRLADPAPATVDGSRVALVDGQGLTYGRRYTYVVLVEDAAGRVSPPSARLSVVYIAPPAAPAHLEATAGEGEVVLRWTAPDRLVDGSPLRGAISYEIARGTGAEGALGTILAPAGGETTFTDRGLVNDQAYSYAVRALRREAGGRALGPLSARVAATPLDLTAPAPPRELVAVVTGKDVRLAWTASPDADVARYVVYRTDTRGAVVRAGSAVPPSATLVDREVPPGRYRYAVTAQDRSARANESIHSNEVSVTVP
jgi:hypothetical protein